MTFAQRVKWVFTGGGEVPPSGEDFRAPRLVHNAMQLDSNRDEVIKRLKSHPIFMELREWSEYRTKVLSIDNPLKQRMAKHYLEILFVKLHSVIEKSIMEYEVYLDDVMAMNNLLIDAFSDVHKSALADGVPEIFLNKITHYMYTQAKILNSTYKDLDNFEYYNSSITRAVFRLDLEFFTIRNITSEIESVINRMNGDLQLALEGSVFDT